MKNKILFIILILLSTYQTTQAQWKQTGSSIYADLEEDKSGFSINRVENESVKAINFLIDKKNVGKLRRENNKLSSTDTMLEDKISIFPNPFKETFTVNYPKKRIKIITITDSSGKIIKSITNTKENNKIDLSKFSNGFYLLNVLIDNKIIAKKIIKKH